MHTYLYLLYIYAYSVCDMDACICDTYTVKPLTDNLPILIALFGSSTITHNDILAP